MSCGIMRHNFIDSACALRRAGLLCALALCLVTALGCTVGPDFHRPTAEVPDKWRGVSPPQAAQASVTTVQPVELATWWEHFSDPVLTSLVNRAIETNLDLAQAKSRIRQARASRGVVASGLWPQVDSSTSYKRSGTGGPSSGGAGGALSRGGTETDLFQAGLDAAWELDIFGGNRRNVEASEADIAAAIEDRRDVLVSLVAEVGNDYLSLRGLQEQIAIAQSNLKGQQHTADITRQRFEAGYVSGLDLANANAQVATTQSQIPALESSVQATIFSLSLLLGQQPGALADELLAPQPIPPVPPAIPVGLPSELLRRRPDIRRSEAQIHAATARIGVATADLFPKFSLTGNFGFSSSDLATFANWGSRAWSFGPSISWSIFSAGKIKSNIEVQNALEEQALITYQKSVLTALKEVETALTAYGKEQERHKALAEAVANNRKAVDLSNRLYMAGRTDFLNVLTAQRALFSSEDALAQSTQNLGTDLVALYKALGGGWENEP